MSNGQRAPWNNVDVTKCTRSICNEDIFWYWKNLIKSGVYVKELFREKYISMYISYISHLFIHLQKNVLNVSEDNLWLFWASRVTCEGDRCISIKLHCEGRWHCPWPGTEYSASADPGGDLIHSRRRGGRQGPRSDWYSWNNFSGCHHLGTHMALAHDTSGQECVVCVQFSF